MRIKISKVVKDLNVGLQTIKDFLNKKNIDVDTSSPNARVDEDVYALLVKEFKPDMEQKLKSENFTSERQKEKAKISAAMAAETAAKEETHKVEEIKTEVEIKKPKVLGKIDLSTAGKPKPAHAAQPKPKPNPSPRSKSSPSPRLRNPRHPPQRPRHSSPSSPNPSSPKQPRPPSPRSLPPQRLPPSPRRKTPRYLNMAPPCSKTPSMWWARST